MTRATQFLLSGVLMVAAPGAALADPPAAPASPTPVASTTAGVAPTAADGVPAIAKPNPGDKVICKYEVPTGSRLGGHKTCMKKSDWDAQAANAQTVMSQRLGNGANSH